MYSYAPPPSFVKGGKTNPSRSSYSYNSTMIYKLQQKARTFLYISKTIAQKKGIGYNVFSKGENKPNANRLYTGGRRKYAKCKIGFEILQYCYTQLISIDEKKQQCYNSTCIKGLPFERGLVRKPSLKILYTKTTNKWFYD